MHQRGRQEGGCGDRIHQRGRALIILILILILLIIVVVVILRGNDDDVMIKLELARFERERLFNPHGCSPSIPA